MKLKPDFVTQDIDNTQYLVSTGAESFNGIVRSNKTAAFIVNLLKEETTPEKIVDAMCARFDAPRETISADVEKILGTLRRINALEEA
ncbi:MAG: PqqD family protein [Parasporobacterium sp.]|nr:PqqD family protein [Parasporobacterium sp.]